MTKQQLSDFLREHDVTVIGFKARDQYVVRQVGDKQFSRKEQRAAHIELIHAYLNIVNAEKSED